MEAAVHTEDITIAYRDKPALWDITVDIPAGSRTAIIGPNGAGKSTLIKGIVGLLKPLTGTITVLDRPFGEVRTRVAYVPQTSSVNWDFPTTVEDVALMGRYPRLGWIRRPRKEDRQKAREALETMSMLEFADRQISQLSGGQRQRVFIARALAQDADLYFMDEPLAGVDVKTERLIMQTVKGFSEQGKTVVAVHHDLSTVEEYFDHVIVINGSLVAAGPVGEVFTKEVLDRAYQDKPMAGE